MEATWIVKETKHYVFHYKTESIAEKEIQQIIVLQEACFKEITEKLEFIPGNKINYWLCDTRKEVMQISEIDFETNGITFCNPNNPTIYAVYSENKKCVGFHEDVHAIACQYAIPDCIAMVEGMAMYFDKVWWGISNELCTRVYLEDKKYEQIEALILDNQYFYQIADMISYPIMGAFTAHLVEKYGIEKYKLLYQNSDDLLQCFKSIYKMNLSELEDDFVKSILARNYSIEELGEARGKLSI